MCQIAVDLAVGVVIVFKNRTFRVNNNKLLIIKIEYHFWSFTCVLLHILPVHLYRTQSARSFLLTIIITAAAEESLER